RCASKSKRRRRSAALASLGTSRAQWCSSRPPIRPGSRAKPSSSREANADSYGSLHLNCSLCKRVPVDRAVIPENSRAERNRSDAERPAVRVHATRGFGRVHCAWHWRGDPIARRTRVTCFGGKKLIKTRELD